MVETALVTLLMQGGFSQRRARYFESWLDDHTPAGVTSDTLAAIILTTRKLRDVEPEQKRRAIVVVEKYMRRRIGLDRKRAVG